VVCAVLLAAYQDVGVLRTQAAAAMAAAAGKSEDSLAGG
jgi:hypothetical protein